MTASVSLTNEMSESLFQSACTMLRDGLKKRGFLEETIAGLISTELKEKTFGQISGVEFFAEVETDLGRGQVKFLVNPKDAENRNKGTWHSFNEVNRPKATSRGVTFH
jgi:hypothetical protein